MDSSSEIVLVMTTVGSLDEAEKISRKLVDQCLAACVQVDGPITSFYRWAGKVEQAAEFRLLIKTSMKAWPNLREKLAKEHPYDEPEIIMTNIDDASEGYRAWVVDQST